MDYRITDAVTDPPVPADDWHCERLLRLPDSQWCFRPSERPVPCPLPAREAGFVTFGSFNTLTKASDTLLRCWVQILVKLPTAHLRLTRVRSAQRAAEIHRPCSDNRAWPPSVSSVCSMQTTRRTDSNFAGVDIALDNYPYNGVTTTCESLYVGVPVVSLHGRNGVSRKQPESSSGARIG